VEPLGIAFERPALAESKLTAVKIEMSDQEYKARLAASSLLLNDIAPLPTCFGSSDQGLHCHLGGATLFFHTAKTHSGHAANHRVANAGTTAPPVTASARDKIDGVPIPLRSPEVHGWTSSAKQEHGISPHPADDMIFVKGLATALQPPGGFSAAAKRGQPSAGGLECGGRCRDAPVANSSPLAPAR
jgi:hypothetical protein